MLKESHQEPVVCPASHLWQYHQSWKGSSEQGNRIDQGIYQDAGKSAWQRGQEAQGQDSPTAQCYAIGKDCFLNMEEEWDTKKTLPALRTGFTDSQAAGSGADCYYRCAQAKMLKRFKASLG